MRIAISGPQSSGKSTLIDMFESIYSMYDLTCLKEITRSVASAGHKINEHGDNISQLLIINSHISRSIRNEYETRIMLYDRCIVDGFVYTKYLHERGNVSDWVLDYCKNVYDMLLPSIDHYFYSSPIGVTIEDDKVRSTSEEFRNRITDLFEEQIKDLRDRGIIVTELTGSKFERYDIVDKVIKKELYNV